MKEKEGDITGIDLRPFDFVLDTDGTAFRLMVLFLEGAEGSSMPCVTQARSTLGALVEAAFISSPSPSSCGTS